MGNLGESSTKCISAPLDKDSLGFHCSGGLIRTLDTVGIKPDIHPDPQECTFDDMTNSCHPALSGIQFRINFYDECMHKEKCSMWNFRDKFIRDNVAGCNEDNSILFVTYTCEFEEEEIPQ